METPQTAAAGAFPHHNFVGRWCGNGDLSGPSRRLHNGRLRRLPNRAMLRAKNKKDMRRLDWYFGTDDGVRSMIRILTEQQ